MMENLTWSNFTTAALTLFVIFCITLDIRKRSQRRLHELKIAKHALDQHNIFMAEFLNDAASPPLLRNMLVDFSDAVLDEDRCTRFAKEFPRAWAAMEATDESRALSAELKVLDKHRPDLRTAFGMSIAGAMVFMLHRWPAAAPVREMMMADIAVNPAKDITIAANTVKKVHGAQRTDDLVPA